MFYDCLKEIGWKKFGIFAAGVAFGTAGIKILSSKECVMKTATTIQENAEDIYEEAKSINEARAAEEEAEVCEEETAEKACQEEAVTE